MSGRVKLSGHHKLSRRVKLSVKLKVGCHEFNKVSIPLVTQTAWHRFKMEGVPSGGIFASMMRTPYSGAKPIERIEGEVRQRKRPSAGKTLKNIYLGIVLRFVDARQGR